MNIFLIYVNISKNTTTLIYEHFLNSWIHFKIRNIFKNTTTIFEIRERFYIHEILKKSWTFFEIREHSCSSANFLRKSWTFKKKNSWFMWKKWLKHNQQENLKKKDRKMRWNKLMRAALGTGNWAYPLLQPFCASLSFWRRECLIEAHTHHRIQYYWWRILPVLKIIEVMGLF